MYNQDHTSEGLETIVWAKILHFFDADPRDGKNSDPGSGKEKVRIRDLG